MSIGKQIESMINTMTDNNIPTKLITIIKGYDTEICDISAENGIIKNVPCSTTATAGDKGLLVYLNGDVNKPFVLLFTAGGGGGDLTNYYTKTEVNNLISPFVTETELNGILSSYVTISYANTNYASKTHNHDDRYYTENEVDTALNGKQDSLVSGTNIKTVNNQSLLGSGNISIGGGGGLSFDDIYPVGSIYLSLSPTFNPNVAFGGTWEQIEDTFLLASGTNHNLGDTGGSENAVVVEHNHTQNSHNHGSGDNTYPNFMTTNINIAVGQTKRTLPSAGSNYYYVYSTDRGDISQHSTTDSKQPTINNRGESGVGKNMPPYLTVNVWERTA